MPKSNATRQREYRERKARVGLETVTGLVHAHQRADVVALLRLLASDPDLTVTQARSLSSGRFVRV